MISRLAWKYNLRLTYKVQCWLFGQRHGPIIHEFQGQTVHDQAFPELAVRLSFESFLA